ncbi:MAG: glycosyltransferase family 4 protein [Parvibaculum sp.]
MSRHIHSSHTGSGPKVLHCLRAPVGGLFRHVRDLAKAQAEMGFRVGILCANEPNDPLTVSRIADLEPYCSLGVTRLSLGRMPGISDAKALLSASWLVRDLQPDVLHGHGAKGGLISRLVGAPSHVARIYTPHGGTIHFSPTSLQGMVFGLAERIMMVRTHGLIFESGFARSIFEERFGIGGDCAAVVYNGVTEEEFATIPLADNPADFLFLGEIRALKGIFTLLEAVKSVSAHRPISVVIVGAGPDEEAFRARIDELGLQSLVRLLGTKPAREAFSLARAVVMPSHHDSFPYVALEAAAAGKPLIATRTGGIPEIFGSQADQLVTPQSVEELAASLMSFLEKPDAFFERAELLRANVVSEFSVRRMALGVAKVYRRASLLRQLARSGKTDTHFPVSNMDAVNE